MPRPISESVQLSVPQRAPLEALIRAGSTPQALVFRCRLILRAADDDQPTNLQIAAEFVRVPWRMESFSRFSGRPGWAGCVGSGRPNACIPVFSSQQMTNRPC
jgi:hypothetical protein